MTDKEKLEGFANGLLEFVMTKTPEINDMQSNVALVIAVGKIHVIIDDLKYNIKKL